MVTLNVTGGTGGRIGHYTSQTEQSHTDSLHRVFMVHTTSYLVQFRFNSIASQK